MSDQLRKQVDAINSAMQESGNSFYAYASNTDRISSVTKKASAIIEIIKAKAGLNL